MTYFGVPRAFSMRPSRKGPEKGKNKLNKKKKKWKKSYVIIIIIYIKNNICLPICSQYVISLPSSVKTFNNVILKKSNKIFKFWNNFDKTLGSMISLQRYQLSGQTRRKNLQTYEPMTIPSKGIFSATELTSWYILDKLAQMATW